MSFKQVLKQNNRTIKSCSGATHLFNKVDESALICWETCGLGKRMNADISSDVLEFDHHHEIVLHTKLSFHLMLKLSPRACK